MELYDRLFQLPFIIKCVVVFLISLPVITFIVIRDLIFLLFVPTFLHKDVSGKIALVTGGASGLGRRIAIELGRRGATVVLWDTNDKGNEETSRIVKHNGGICFTYTVDISRRESIYSMAEVVKADVGKVDILVNNAGVSGPKKWVPQIPDKGLSKTMDINFFSHTWTVNAFLPDMIASNSGHIIAVSSLSGITASHFIEYSSSKFAVIGFMLSLKNQLCIMEHTGITTTILCPSYIDTPLLTEEFGDVPKMSSDAATELLIDAILRNKDFLIIPTGAKIVPLIVAITPPFIMSIAYRFLFWGDKMKKTL